MRNPLRSFGSTGSRNKGGFRLVRREGADRDGVSSVETVILKDDDGPRLARIVLAARNGPDVAASHSSRSGSAVKADTVSMNA